MFAIKDKEAVKDQDNITSQTGLELEFEDIVVLIIFKALEVASSMAQILEEQDILVVVTLQILFLNSPSTSLSYAPEDAPHYNLNKTSLCKLDIHTSHPRSAIFHSTNIQTT